MTLIHAPRAAAAMQHLGKEAPGAGIWLQRPLVPLGDGADHHAGCRGRLVCDCQLPPALLAQQPAGAEAGQQASCRAAQLRERFAAQLALLHASCRMWQICSAVLSSCQCSCHAQTVQLTMLSMASGHWCWLHKGRDAPQPGHEGHHHGAGARQTRGHSHQGRQGHLARVGPHRQRGHPCQGRLQGGLPCRLRGCWHWRRGRGGRQQRHLRPAGGRAASGKALPGTGIRSTASAGGPQTCAHTTGGKGAVSSRLLSTLDVQGRQRGRPPGGCHMPAGRQSPGRCWTRCPPAAAGRLPWPGLPPQCQGSSPAALV